MSYVKHTRNNSKLGNDEALQVSYVKTYKKQQ